MKDQITVDLSDLPAQKRTASAEYVADHSAGQRTVFFSRDASVKHP
ncbi:hypothetical protein [Pseudomonas sp. TWRC1-2]